MNAQSVIASRWLPLGLMIMLVVATIIPWVEVGSVGESTTVAGIEIPVIGVATIIVCLMGAGFLLGGALRPSGWWWVGASGVAGVITTLTALWLVTLDVVDSGIVRAIRKLLPENIRDASPTLSPDIGLWVILILSTAICALATRFAVTSANARWTPSGAGDPTSRSVEIRVEIVEAEFWDD
ncbi:MAG: hypothetical protein WCJ88_10200 [Actinomycetes bacterium]